MNDIFTTCPGVRLVNCMTTVYHESFLCTLLSFLYWCVDGRQHVVDRLDGAAEEFFVQRIACHWITHLLFAFIFRSPIQDRREAREAAAFHYNKGTERKPKRKATFTLAAVLVRRTARNEPRYGQNTRRLEPCKAAYQGADDNDGNENGAAVCLAGLRLLVVFHHPLIMSWLFSLIFCSCRWYPA